MIKIKNTIISLTLIALIMLITACGFHLRRAQDFPAQLRTLYLSTPNSYSELTAQLTNLLKAMHVNLVTNPGLAPVTLKIISIELTHTRPNISSTNLPTTYSFLLTVKLELTNDADQPLTPVIILQAQQSISLIGNQILVPGTSEPIQQELIRQMVNMIYNWLTIKDTLFHVP